MKGLWGAVLVAIMVTAGAVWYYQSRGAANSIAGEPADDEWVDHLYSQNTKDAAEAVHHVEMLGERAVPIIIDTLEDPGSDRERKRAALKACGILGPVAAPAIPAVAKELPNPELTAEAALALSFLGRQAFVPLKEALTSDDPVVRREALRSIGKLKDRAPLDSRAVVPLLISGMSDADAGVRAVAATYLGIISQAGEAAVPALMEGLKDHDVEVRRASAEALGSFGPAAAEALPALRRAAADPDPDVAREAGLAVIKLQPSKENR